MVTRANESPPYSLASSPERFLRGLAGRALSPRRHIPLFCSPSEQGSIWLGVSYSFISRFAKPIGLELESFWRFQSWLLPGSGSSPQAISFCTSEAICPLARAADSSNLFPRRNASGAARRRRDGPVVAFSAGIASLLRGSASPLGLDLSLGCAPTRGLRASKAGSCRSRMSPFLTIVS